MAAVDYFLKIEGVDGESTDDKHKGEIDIDSFSWGETQSGTHSGGGGGGAGKVVMQDLHFTTKMSKATPKLMLACATGEHFKKATLICRKAGKEQQEFLKITLSDLLVSSYQTGGSSHGGVVPTDQFSLNFAKIEYEYKPQKTDGSLDSPVKAGYDLKANKKV
jgi:type VI secretion system secreted protein Hcp